MHSQLSKCKTQANQQNIETHYQTQRKLTNLFYVKSKHTQKYFHNHSYFMNKNPLQQQEQDFNKVKNNVNELRQKNKVQSRESKKRYSLINEKRLKTQFAQSVLNNNRNEKERENKQFVNCPTEYGLDNTYKYLRDKSFLNNSMRESSTRSQCENPMTKSKEKRRYTFLIRKKTIQGDEQKSYMKNTAAYKSKFMNSTINRKSKQPLSFSCNKQLPNSQSIYLDKNLSQIKPHAHNNVKFHSSKSLPESMLPHSRNIIYNTKNVLSSTHSLLPSTHCVKHQVQFIFGKRLKSYNQIPYRIITLDIFPFLLNTFLKCKIHYKQMTLQEFKYIKSSILKVISFSQTSSKSYTPTSSTHDKKDIINISSIKALLKYLNQFEQTEIQWIETIKYFFIPKEKNILEYQMDKIKDQVGKLVGLKYEMEFGQKEVIMFNVESGKEIKEFYQMMKEGRFLVGDDKRVMEEYKAVVNQNAQKLSFQSKIRKWKGLAQCQDLSEQQKLYHNSNKSTLQRTITPSSTLQFSKIKFSGSRKLTQQKFNNLFEQFKLRKMKKMKSNYQGNKKLSQSSLDQTKRISIAKFTQPFIEKAKLKKEVDIFQ